MSPRRAAEVFAAMAGLEVLLALFDFDLLRPAPAVGVLWVGAAVYTGVNAIRRWRDS